MSRPSIALSLLLIAGCGCEPVMLGSAGASTGGAGAGSPGLGGAGGTAGLTGSERGGAAGSAGVAGFGAQSGSAGHPGTGGTSGSAGMGGVGGSAGEPPVGFEEGPETAWEPPTTSPVTAMEHYGEWVVSGHLNGDVYCGKVQAEPGWWKCSEWMAAGRTFALPARTITAVHVEYPTTYATLGMSPDGSEPVVYSSSRLQSWSSRGVSETSVYGISRMPYGEQPLILVTSTGFYEEQGAGTSWLKFTPIAERPVTAELMPEGSFLGKAWVGTDQGKLYYVPDPANASSESSWTAIGISQPGATAVGITVNPANKDRVYVTFRTLAPSGLHLTEDGGKNFLSNIKLPVKPNTGAGALSAVSVNPQFPDVLYITAFTPEPVPLKSRDGGHSWRRMIP